jgi:hypothetical protein
MPKKSKAKISMEQGQYRRAQTSVSLGTSRRNQDSDGRTQAHRVANIFVRACLGS